VNCLECGGGTEVIDTQKFPSYVWRKRRCLKCGCRVNTHENFADDTRGARVKKKVEEPNVEPLPVRNPRKQIEDIREYLEYRRKLEEEDGGSEG